MKPSSDITLPAIRVGSSWRTATRTSVPAVASPGLADQPTVVIRFYLALVNAVIIVRRDVRCTRRVS